MVKFDELKLGDILVTTEEVSLENEVSAKLIEKEKQAKIIELHSIDNSIGLLFENGEVVRTNSLENYNKRV